VAVFLLCLAIGVAAEVNQRLFVVYARLQSIIVTLATSLIFGGVALYVMPQPADTCPNPAHDHSPVRSGLFPTPRSF